MVSIRTIATRKRMQVCAVVATGLAACTGLSCNVPEPPPSTGGVSLEAGACGRGVVVSSSGDDYASTNISLATWEGVPISESFLSSGSLPAGASATLSGDVVLPLSTPRSGNVVLIDRQNNTITWADSATGSVLGQLSVAEGVSANPQDYIEVTEEEAYVSRWTPGDLLRVNPRTAQATGKIPLEGEGDKLPCPGRMVLAGKQIIVALQMFASDFKSAAEGRLVGIVSGQVSWEVTVGGLANCGALALSPSGQELALACTGVFPDPNSTDAEQIKHSGVVLYSLGEGPVQEKKRYSVAQELGAPLGWTIDFASEEVVVGRALGDLTSGRSDLAFALALSSGEVRKLAEAPAYAFGDVRCAAKCAGGCLLADASLGAVRRWTAGLQEAGTSKVDTKVGLLPRFLGGF